MTQIQEKGIQKKGANLFDAVFQEMEEEAQKAQKKGRKPFDEWRARRQCVVHVTKAQPMPRRLGVPCHEPCYCPINHIRI